MHIAIGCVLVALVPCCNRVVDVGGRSGGHISRQECGKC